jgi:hypothetical protein
VDWLGTATLPDAVPAKFSNYYFKTGETYSTVSKYVFSLVKYNFAEYLPKKFIY